jgi:hypothetical protein
MASYNAGTVHTNPTLDGSGTFNVWRDGNNVRVTGTAKMHKGARI